MKEDDPHLELIAAKANDFGVFVEGWLKTLSDDHKRIEMARYAATVFHCALQYAQMMGPSLTDELLEGDHQELHDNHWVPLVFQLHNERANRNGE